MAPPKQTDPQFKLRLPPELKEKIERAAEKNSRSMNAEIIARLDAFDDLEKLLSDFELAKGQIIEGERREKALKNDVAMLHRVANNAQDISRQLITVLMQKLGMSEDEIAAITKPSRE